MGKYLRKRHGFRHFDFEGRRLIEYLPDGVTPDEEAFGQLKREGRDVVITWGFVPDTQLSAVRALNGFGFRWIWFDGDRAVALREYLSLGRLRSDWDRQLAKIQTHIDPIIASLAPVVVNTFDVSGQRRPLEHVARDVLS